MSSSMNGHPIAPSALVLYGTETGTSQDLAEEVGRCLERMYFTVDVVGFELATFNVLQSYTLTVFVVATTGQGDFPSNARKFWTSLLRKKLGASTLAGVEFALVGLGDSSYLKFNWAARKLRKRLTQLGAGEIVEACEADDQGDQGTDGDFLDWLQGFREAVLKRFPSKEGQEPISDKEELPNKWLLKPAIGDTALSDGIQTTDSDKDYTNGHVQSVAKFTVALEENKRVTPASHWQDVRLLRLRAPGDYDYLPGDALAINPENMPQDVDVLLNLMQWWEMADRRLIIAPNDAHLTRGRLFHLAAPFSLDYESVTLRKLLTQFLAFNAIPRRSFFSAIAKYTSDSMHKERLLEFTDPQYIDEYYDYATRPRRSILEILQEFNTVKIPWQEAINVFPILRPRQFSIASGGRLKGNAGETNFELLVAIVKYKTVIRRIREGVCTRYLAQLPVGTRLNVEVKREGRFHSRAEIARTSHLLIGAGTGIAPLRSLIHEKLEAGVANTDTTLIFGARNAHADYFFRDEWTKMQGGLLELHTAFSRDQKEKVYVQDRLRAQWQNVSKMLHDPKTVIIVCGASGQMPKAVRHALVDVLTGAASQTQAEGAINDPRTMAPDDAEQFVARLEKEGRYKQETWS